MTLQVSVGDPTVELAATNDASLFQALSGLHQAAAHLDSCTKVYFVLSKDSVATVSGQSAPCDMAPSTPVDVTILSSPPLLHNV